MKTNEALRLAEYLKQNPDAFSLGAESLASQANVSLATVQRALGEIRQPARETGQVRVNRPRLRWPRFIEDTWIAATNSPAMFVLWSSLGAIILGWLLNRDGTRPVVNLALVAVVALLHGLCYYRHGSWKVVLKGAAGFYGILVLLSIITAMEAVPDMPVDNLAVYRFGQFIIIAIAFAFGLAVYVMAGLAFAVLGGYVKVRHQDRRLDNLDRQQLIERLFEVQERLASISDQGDEAVRPSYRIPLVAAIAEAPFVWAILLGAGLNTANVFIQAASGHAPNNFVNATPAEFVAIFAVFACTLVSQTFIAFVTPRVLQSILVSLCYTLAGVPAMLLPVGGWGIEWYLSNWQQNVLWAFSFAFILGVIGGFGGVVEQRHSYNTKLHENDVATLLNALFEIQKRLQPDAQEITVMVVDAAQSSAMKAAADPFVAEWSFREYQRFLDRIATRHRGNVFSTAGDGATLTFEVPQDAIDAGLEIQDEIEIFNREVNKLSREFRLRIGIHCGKVTGDIEQVQYTEVIDIAAHLESVCPEGELVVSESLLRHLPDLAARPIETPVDDLKVYVVQRS